MKFGYSTLTHKKNLPYCFISFFICSWQLDALSVCGWQLILFFFQRLVFSIKPWVTKNWFKWPKVKKITFFLHFFSFQVCFKYMNLFKFHDIPQIPCKSALTGWSKIFVCILKIQQTWKESRTFAFILPQKKTSFAFCWSL